mmetsp:Transcript_290/g.407  ORF Transcript_290/g.407 Transcript_290/m.407 type:complete len:95 (-) Transcript_290:82-366(-)
MPETKRACWKAKESFMKCIIQSQCYTEKQDLEECISAPECFLERKNWVICKLNANNPKYRLRGNPYDVMTEDQKKTSERAERIQREMDEERGIS